ncbi:PREDICTED: transmembrane protein 14 homolog [Bactrocera latifrons]|uniref:Transmembrane protein 14 homolog n=3 Tax=Endopterygota TaxID=33392 RepID=A0A034WKI4_BACDO|nr:transmembrane protein 14 homolog [Bactrocera dorsalis]XP_018795523.1 PREDICTED: transmembrane protein 14 homolog [Bactrocera latifrons]XP_039957467.1 transmembrane protein 14 homolog [Bactrocera tryoni]XP_050327661.1 transmembrane protein 14 homolog [Bactrocera neohumeralis]
MSTDLIGFLYAATVAAGGIMGYVKAGSIPSLGAGVAFGAILGVGAYYNSQDPPRPLLQLGTSVALAGIMGSRWQRSGKMMPAGMICIISVAAILRNLITYNRYLPLPGRQQ